MFLILLIKLKYIYNSRWATEGTERLPEPMKFCLNILYDTVDEISNELLSEKGYMVKTYLQNAVKKLLLIFHLIINVVSVYVLCNTF